ncbi:uncharacterized protein LOC133784678 [Humulus lupulus]|uniref:uncharacterized protein LOC133784678 n=1 Tax=Humulus lupulus TaxID=3486 RepID=UPI002B40ECC0|nr:uncharacterized protein LOC133784678 [Humulus lupulus]
MEMETGTRNDYVRKPEEEEMAMAIRKGMKNKWKEVVELYSRHPLAHVTRISRSGYTALHVAVSDGKEDIVKKLVAELVKTAPSGVPAALKIRNEEGNTPLHVAASMGSVDMCKLIVSGDVSLDRTGGAELVEIQNELGETPLFLAAFHGKMQTFLYLNDVLVRRRKVEDAIRSCRRNDGDTILHCTINAEYMDLAFQIVKSYKELAMYVNDDGESPLHILAEKPSAFKSSTKFGIWRKIIYGSITVEKPKAITNYEDSPKEKAHKDYPQNYATLIGCFHLLKKLALAVFFYLIIISIIFYNLVVYGNRGGRKEADPEDHMRNDKRNHEDIAKEVDRKNPVKNVKEKSAARNRNDDENEYSSVVPYNYINLFNFGKLLLKGILVLTGQGYGGIINMIQLKEKHTYAQELLFELLTNDLYSNERPGEMPHAHGGIHDHEIEEDEIFKKILKEVKRHKKTDTAVLIASRNGITEMVEAIVEKFPLAIYDVTEDKKNIVLVALEHRKAQVYKLLLKTHPENESLFWKLDKNGNSALHIAAQLDRKRHNQWNIPGDALQLLWEIKWYKFVDDTMPQEFNVRFNKEKKTPAVVFTENHEDLVKSGGEWMTKTAEACSVVSTLIATVAFASSTALPGGNNDNGVPIFEKAPAFKIFAMSSLAALSFSITSLVMFLAILTSRLSERDFGKSLPLKLLIGLTSLFISIASMLVSFCAGHFFVLKDSLKVAAFPVYALTCIPVTFFAMAQCPLYFDLVCATFRNPFGDATKILSYRNDIQSKRELQD